MKFLGLSEGSWLVIVQALLVALVPLLLERQRRRAVRAQAVRDEAEGEKLRKDAAKADAEAADVVSRAAAGLVEPLDRRVREVEAEAQRLRLVVAELEQTVREQAAKLREQACEIRELRADNSRKAAAIELLTRQVLQLGAKPAVG